MNDVIFAYRPRLLSVAAQLKRSAHAGQRTHGTTFRALKVTSQVATPGAESTVYDCLVARAVSTARFCDTGLTH